MLGELQLLIRSFDDIVNSCKPAHLRLVRGEGDVDLLEGLDEPDGGALAKHIEELVGAGLGEKDVSALVLGTHGEIGN